MKPLIITAECDHDGDGVFFNDIESHDPNDKFEIGANYRFIEIEAYNKVVEALRKAVKTWGDYSPLPNSNAGKALENARNVLNELGEP